MNPLYQVSSPLQILPAYGSRYLNSDDMMMAWNSGKDFKIWNGPYCSVRDLPALRKESDRIYIMSPLDDICVRLNLGAEE
jgi:hypothetical protein